MKRKAEDVDDLINSGICTLGSLSKNKGRQGIKAFN